MRNMSFMLTTEQMRQRAKTVTRRMGWLNLKIGDRVQAVEKCQGLKAGEKIRPICVIEIMSVRREVLRKMLNDPAYGRIEIRLEGFGDKTPEWFVAMFCRSHGRRTPDAFVTRIEFRYV